MSSKTRGVACPPGAGRATRQALRQEPRGPALLALLHEVRPFPATVVRLIDAVSNSGIEMGELSRLIGEDPALVAELLRQANSAARVRVSRVSSLDEAVMAVGQRGIAEMALTVLCGRYLLEGVPAPEVARALWRHSLAVGALSRALAPRFGADGGQAATAGLLHEIGLIVALRAVPKQIQALSRAAGEGLEREELEEKHLGCSGARLSAHVAALLGLPSSLVELFLEACPGSSTQSPEGCSLAHANALAPMLGFAAFPGTCTEPLNQALEALLDGEKGLARELADTALAATRVADAEAPGGLQALSVSPEAAFDALLQANRRLAQLNLDYARTRREVELRVQESRSLVETLTAITMGLDVSALRYSVLEALMEHFPVDVCFLVNSQHGEGLMDGIAFHHEQETGACSSPLQVDMAQLQPESRQSLWRGRSILLEEGAQEGALFGVLGSLSKLQVAPLMVRGRCTGLLGVGLTHGREGFPSSPSHVEVIAGSAALGIENARLYQSTLKEATRDVLTGVKSRRAILEDLEELCRTGTRPLALIMLDLDNFKRVNDTLGHQEGDRFLRDAVQAVEPVLPKGAWMGRYGGDEFLILMVNVSQGEAEECARRIGTKLGRLGRAPRWRRVDAPLGASLGLACLDHGSMQTDLLLAAADRSLYEAKAQGGRGAGPVRQLAPGVGQGPSPAGSS